MPFACQEKLNPVNPEFYTAKKSRIRFHFSPAIIDLVVFGDLLTLEPLHHRPELELLSGCKRIIKFN